MGYIKGKQCIVVANDATVKAGAWFPITAKKNLRTRNPWKIAAYHLFSR
jgi:acetyl-CoA carboxylase carboxyltransferase component